jgi:hypothetical protein
VSAGQRKVNRGTVTTFFLTNLFGHQRKSLITRSMFGVVNNLNGMQPLADTA